MVQLTRQDCAIASAGLMRSGLAHALHHARHRSVFQKHLADQPLMQAVLSDMALHVEASIALVMRLCRAFDRAPSDAKEAAYMRLLTPAIKYWVCKSAPGFLYEAMECLGGNGYVEEGILARHYRELPVNAIWEGSGNVMCLDVLRALSREADAASAVLHELTGETLGLPGAGEAVGFIGKAFRRPDSERVARLAVEKLALLAAARGAQRGDRRGMRNCSPPRALPGITPACTARSILPAPTSLVCWNGRCPESQLMDSLSLPQPPLPSRPPCVRPGSGSSGARRCGGCSSLPACSSARPLSSVTSCCGRKVRSDLAAAIHVVGAGLTISLSVIMGLPAVLLAAWVATRASRTPFVDYLALRWTTWQNFLIGAVSLAVLVGGWDLLSRALGREVTPGFMGDVLKSAQADGALWLLVIAFCVAAPISEEILARGFLYRGWSESRLGVPGAIFLSSLAWTSLHLQYDWFFFGEVFTIGLLLGYFRYRTGSTWLTIVLHGLNNTAATMQTFWLAGQ